MAKDKSAWQRLRAKILAKTDGYCAYCGEKLDELWHLDHIVPKSQGGKLEEKNGFPSCPKCNVRKGGCTPGEFRDWIADKIERTLLRAWVDIEDLLIFFPDALKHRITDNMVDTVECAKGLGPVFYFETMEKED
jgi:hypothetical protein